MRSPDRYCLLYNRAHTHHQHSLAIMWRLTVVVILALGATAENVAPKSGDELVSTVLRNCVEMDCVKSNVLGYLDNLLKIDSDARNAKVVTSSIKIILI